MELLKYFKIELVKGSVKRIQLTDEEYFGPKYKDYVSNSKMGLLNPAQGGSPQKFLEGFKSSGSAALSLGSAVHQLTLEKEDYVLSDVIRPAGKLGDAYEEFKKLRMAGKPIEESLILACNNAEYYVSRLKTSTGKGLPAFIRDGIVKCLPFYNAEKTKKTEDGKSIIYLPSDQYKKCVGCVDSISKNVRIQEQLMVPISYCEDVILCEVEVTFPKDFNNPTADLHKTIVKLKMKADHWSINHVDKIFILNDVKTTGKPIQYFMGYEVEEEGFMGNSSKVFKNGSFQTFHYSRQMAEFGPCFRNNTRKPL